MTKNSLKGWLIMWALFWSGPVLSVQVCKTTITAGTPVKDFVDNNDGTLTHVLTGLTWKRCAEGQVWEALNQTCSGTETLSIWRLALQEVEALNTVGGFAGHVDWRLPNVKELISIVEERCHNPSINEVLFPVTPLIFWSSSPSATDATQAWGIRFSGGSSDVFSKNQELSIRLVRAGQ